jgi:hypothetical protein
MMSSRRGTTVVIVVVSTTIRVVVVIVVATAQIALLSLLLQLETRVVRIIGMKIGRRLRMKGRRRRG